MAQGYRENTPDPSVFVRFPLKDDPKTAFLVWTTTPWTLPANVAVAVHPDVMYAKVERKTAAGEKEFLILARDLVEKVFEGEEVKIVGDYKGKELSGWKYQPLFTFLPLEKQAHRVVLGGFVTVEDGTGVVHQAPAFGAEDMQMSIENDLPVLMTVDESGCFIPQVTPWKGMFVKDADPLIIADLTEPRIDAAQRDHPPHLPVLLAVRYAAPVLRAQHLVHPHHAVPRPDDRT